MRLLAVSAPALAYICLGGFVVGFSMLSLLVKEKLFINEVVLGTVFGILIGPYCADVFNPRSWGAHNTTITLEVMRVVLAMGLFALGVELPQSYMARHVKGLSILVIPTMAIGWIVVASFVCVLFPGLNFISSLVISACLTPTDPIICATIVSGKFAIKNVPVNLRRILAAESGANDSLAYPFLNIALYLTLEASRRVAITKWFLVSWLYQVVLGVVLGAVLGVTFSRIMRISHRMGFIDHESFVAQYLALAFLTFGVASAIGTDDLLAAFAAGTAISWDGHFNEQTEGQAFASVLDFVLNCGCFVYIGAWLPFTSFDSPQFGIKPWKLGVLFVAILSLRRIPPLLLLYRWIPEITTWKEALFSGHFGPMGVGAVFISTLALTKLPRPHDPPQSQPELLAASLEPIVAFMVLGSIFTHGLSIPFFTLGRTVQSRTLSHTVTLIRTMTTPTPAGPKGLLRIWRRNSEEQPENVPVALTPTVDVESEAVEAENVTIPTQLEEVHRKATMQSISFVKRSDSVPTLRGDAMATSLVKRSGLEMPRVATASSALLH